MFGAVLGLGEIDDVTLLFPFEKSTVDKLRLEILTKTVSEEIRNEREEYRQKGNCWMKDLDQSNASQNPSPLINPKRKLKLPESSEDEKEMESPTS